MKRKIPTNHINRSSQTTLEASAAIEQDDIERQTSEDPVDLKSWGTQSIHRAVAILRQVATYGHSGAKAGDLADGLGLDRATVYRMLRGLGVEGMVVQDSSTKRYRLGQTVYELGQAASFQYDLKDVCQPSLHHLA